MIMLLIFIIYINLLSACSKSSAKKDSFTKDDEKQIRLIIQKSKKLIESSAKKDSFTKDDEKQIRLIIQKSKKLIEKGEIEKAKKELLKVGNRWPKDFHLVVGNEYFKRKNYEQAIKEYKEALKYEPDSSDIHGQLAKIYYFMGKNQKALEECKIAIEMGFNNAEYHYLLSGILMEMGNSDKALKEIKKAININPDFAPFLLFMGRIYEKMGNQNEALNAYLKAISKDETYISAYSSAIMIAICLNKEELAIKLLKKNKKLQPDNYIIKELLQRLKSKKEDKLEKSTIK